MTIMQRCFTSSILLLLACTVESSVQQQDLFRDAKDKCADFLSSSEDWLSSSGEHLRDITPDFFGVVGNAMEIGANSGKNVMDIGVKTGKNVASIFIGSKEYRTTQQRVDAVINYGCATNAASGFLTSVGGFATLPVGLGTSMLIQVMFEPGVLLSRLLQL
jgi:hypothetical protein